MRILVVVEQSREELLAEHAVAAWREEMIEEWVRALVIAEDCAIANRRLYSAAMQCHDAGLEPEPDPPVTFREKAEWLLWQLLEGTRWSDQNGAIRVLVAFAIYDGTERFARCEVTGARAARIHNCTQDYIRQARLAGKFGPNDYRRHPDGRWLYRRAAIWGLRRSK